MKFPTRLLVYCGLVIAWPASTYSHACERIAVDYGAMVAMADAVIEAQVKEAHASGRLEVRLVSAIKGKTPATILVYGLPPAANQRKDCAPFIPKPGQSAIFLLRSLEAGEFRVLNPSTGAGVIATTPEMLAHLKEKARGKGPASSWTPAPGESKLSARLLARQSEFKDDETIDLFVALRNDAPTPTKIPYRTWPPKEHTYCELLPVGQSGLVSAIPTGISEADIAANFSKNGQRFETEVQSDEFYLLTLKRINSAAQGWGYKEELGFRSYPLPPGTYDISAKCLGFLPEPIITSTIRLTVRPKTKSP